MANRALVIGGANTDIFGFADSLIRRDSNLGRVSLQAGGVGRNIAENLLHLECDVGLITVFGSDMLSASLKQSTADMGMDISHAITVKEERPCVYMAVIDPVGDMDIAVNDMAIMRNIDIAYIQSHADYINTFDIIVPDANLMPDVLEYIVDHFPQPMVFDPVSVSKAEAAKRFIGKFFALKMNRIEAQHITGIGSPQLAALRLVEMGAQQAYVTNGQEGSWYADNQGNQGDVPALPLTPVNTTGAGDAYTAGVVYGLLNGMDIGTAARFANLCSVMALRSEAAVNRSISIRTLMAEQEKQL